VEVDCYQEAVDIVHSLEYFLAAVDVAVPQGIQQMSPEFACCLCEPVEVGSIVDTEIIRLGQLISRNQR
jgi:hypothetical protein